MPTHATNPRGGQNDPVERLPFCLAQPRVDVAANVDDARIRSQTQDLHFAPARRRADQRMRGQQVQRRAMSRDQDVARVVAIGVGHDRYRGMECGGEIFGRMDRGVDLAAEHGGFNRCGEDATPADLGQRRRLVDIALGRNDVNLDGTPGVNGAEPIRGEMWFGRGRVRCRDCQTGSGGRETVG